MVLLSSRFLFRIGNYSYFLKKMHNKGNAQNKPSSILDMWLFVLFARNMGPQDSKETVFYPGYLIVRTFRKKCGPTGFQRHRLLSWIILCETDRTFHKKCGPTGFQRDYPEYCVTDRSFRKKWVAGFQTEQLVSWIINMWLIDRTFSQEMLAHRIRNKSSFILDNFIWLIVLSQEPQSSKPSIVYPG